jgi:hypothetical protein
MKSIQLKNRIRSSVALTVLALAIAAVMVPDLAFAQGQGQALLDYSYEEYGRPMLNFGVIGAAITMFFLRFNYIAIGTLAAGGLTFANYSSIAALFGA